MTDYISEILADEALIKKIQNKLPELFQIAEIDNSRDGKLGMEIGSAREKIIIALFIYKFGIEQVKIDIPITENEIDVIVMNQAISIKTVTGKKINGIKLIWTVDQEKALNFRQTYTPNSDLILIQINWQSLGYIYFIPLTSQIEVLEKLSLFEYIKLPKPGTNARGVELSSHGIRELINHPFTKNIEIFWQRKNIKYNSYERWIEYWR
jgi:hypothetical protein